MYPALDMPWVGAPWIIGAIAIVHVFLSHFGVGGGLYLPIMERHARKTGDAEMLAYLRRTTKFYLIVTGVLGATTGVGIWFAIGLANPTTTSWLIHTFVFAWAIEWVVFLVEMTAITAYHYTWGKVTPEAHQNIGWVMAGASWLSVVVINGILTFMLTPGSVWMNAAPGSRSVWMAYVNPGYLPSLILRTLLAWSLAAVWGFLPATAIKSPGVRKRIMHATALWAIPAYLLMPFVALWYLHTVPAGAIAVLRGGVNGMAIGNLSIATRVLMVVIFSSCTLGLIVWFGPWKNPQSFSRGQAIGLLLLTMLATGATEWVREVLRKPYTVHGVMYSSGVRVDQVAELQQSGYLANAPWARAFADEHGGGTLARGEALFRSQCMACHTRQGYRGLDKLIGPRDLESAAGFVTMLRATDPKTNAYLAFMPPFVGTATEARDLAAYLVTLEPSSSATPAAP